MNYKNKNVLVYGMSASGEWASKLLLKLKANVYLYDDNKDKLKTKAVKNCFFVQELNEDLLSQFNFIVVSPSIEKDNPYLIIANKLNIKIYSELEFASQFCKKLVAVTGTNGKTTTVELITAILNQKYKAVACGNIGYPLSRAVLENKKAIKVAEVSSFMLEHATSFKPQIATILNIQPDHLVRHKTMEEYTKLKYNLLTNLNKNNYCVVNLDQNITPTRDVITVTYSYNHQADVCCKQGTIYLHNNKLIDINQLTLKGKHNIYNVMCAICFASILKVKPKQIVKALTNFSADRFRIERVAKINGVTFINDSKSTNIASTLACVETIKSPITLLLGGSKKGLDYSKLFNALPKRVKQIVAYGEIASELEQANNGMFNFKASQNLNDAFDLAVSKVVSGDYIVLSPATASYDQFSSYIARGEAFNKKVKEYETSKKKE